MKTLEHSLLKKTLKLGLFALITFCHLGVSHYLVGQNIINIVNPSHPNLGNINTNNDVLQYALINNAVNVNSQIIQSMSNPRVIIQSRNSLKKSTKNAVIKPHATLSNKLVNKQLAVNNKPNVMKRKKKKLPVANKRVAASSKPVIEIQQAIVNQEKNIQFVPQQVIMKDNPIVATLQQKQRDNEITINLNERKVDSSIRNTSRMSKKNQNLYSLKRKKFNRFCHSTNKKFAKLFARDRKCKIDPAKCFAWS